MEIDFLLKILRLIPCLLHLWTCGVWSEVIWSLEKYGKNLVIFLPGKVWKKILFVLSIWKKKINHFTDLKI